MEDTPLLATPHAPMAAWAVMPSSRCTIEALYELTETWS